MKTTVTQHDFIEAFRSRGRYDQFGYEALECLFSYFEEIEDSTGEEMELDIIAVCCEYACGTWKDVANDYDIELPEGDDEEKIETVREYLQENTILVGEVDNDSFVYALF